MPWSCRILLQHHKKKFNAIAQNVCSNCFQSICQGAKIRAIREFCIFVSPKWTYEANFPSLNICRKSMKSQSSGLKYPCELCFGIMNTTKDSYLLSSKVAYLKRGQNAAGICPIFYIAFGHMHNECETKAWKWRNISLVCCSLSPWFPLKYIKRI